MTKTLYYSENPQPSHGYTMFSFFRFENGRLHLGQCQAVNNEEIALTRDALKHNGWTPGGYKYVNGKAVLVDGR